jgi:hypothetical protein
MPSNEQYKFMCFPFGAVANMNTNCYSAHGIPVIDHGYLARIPTHVSNNKHTEYDMTKSIEVFVQLFSGELPKCKSVPLTVTSK